MQRSLALVAIATVCTLASTGSSLAQSRLAKKYGTRDPRVCAKAASTSKTISAAEAAASVSCNGEYELGNQSLFLLEDVKVTFIGKGQRPNPNAVSYPTLPDLSSLAYPIQGSFKKYQCGEPDLSPPGKSCRLYVHANAKGECYKDTFQQWHCGMSDQSVGRQDYEDVAPPKAIH
jgi:hypothetical protein